MINIPVTAKCSDRDIAFGELPNGRCFVYMKTHPRMNRLLGDVFIKLARNRIQVLADSNMAFDPPGQHDIVREINIFFPEKVPPVQHR